MLGMSLISKILCKTPLGDWMKVIRRWSTLNTCSGVKCKKSIILSETRMIRFTSRNRRIIKGSRSCSKLSILKRYVRTLKRRTRLVWYHLKTSKNSWLSFIESHSREQMIWRRLSSIKLILLPLTFKNPNRRQYRL